MSEERFDRIDTELHELRSGLADVRSELQTGLAEVRSDLRSELRSGLAEVRTELADLGRHMRVLHEDLKSDIRALRPEGPSRREVKRWDDEVRRDLGQRLDPLEGTVRSHSAEIARLKQKRP